MRLFKLPHFPLPILFSNYAAVDAGIDRELYPCVVTGPFSHRPIVTGAFAHNEVFFTLYANS